MVYEAILKAIGFVIAGGLILLFGFSIIGENYLAGAILIVIGLGALIGAFITIRNAV